MQIHKHKNQNFHPQKISIIQQSSLKAHNIANLADEFRITFEGHN